MAFKMSLGDPKNAFNAPAQRIRLDVENYIQKERLREEVIPLTDTIDEVCDSHDVGVRSGVVHDAGELDGVIARIRRERENAFLVDERDVKAFRKMFTVEQVKIVRRRLVWR